MPNQRANKAASMRMQKMAIKKSANDKPSQFKKVGDFRPGGMFSTGRMIKAQPETRKKASKSAGMAGASKEKRVAGPSTRAKTSSKAPRAAAKPTGARDRNRRTY
jgi:hypothetical protein